jgi:hypothetical protein
MIVPMCEACHDEEAGPTGCERHAAIRRHGFETMLVSNGAFTRMTGIKRVCFDCGAADPRKGSPCLGRKLASPVAPEEETK